MSNGKIKTISVTTTTAWSVYAVITRVQDGFKLNADSGFFEQAPANYALVLAEVATVYSIAESRSEWLDGLYTICYFRKLSTSPAMATDTLLLSNVVILNSDIINTVLNASPIFTGTTKVVAETLTGKLTTAVGTIAGAMFNLPTSSADPTTPVEGDVWKTATALRAYLNGAKGTITFTAD